jgi:hypothetical protein
MEIKGGTYGSLSDLTFCDVEREPTNFLASAAVGKNHGRRRPSVVALILLFTNLCAQLTSRFSDVGHQLNLR